MTHGSAKLTHGGKVLALTIGKRITRYLIERVPCEHPTIKLTKEDGVVHQVSEINGKTVCDCEAATYRPHERCKHRKILVAIGLLKEKKDEDQGGNRKVH